MTPLWAWAGVRTNVGADGGAFGRFVAVATGGGAVGACVGWVGLTIVAGGWVFATGGGRLVCLSNRQVPVADQGQDVVELRVVGMLYLLFQQEEAC